jgi:hypothetical protein
MERKLDLFARPLHKKVMPGRVIAFTLSAFDVAEKSTSAIHQP